MRQGELLSFYLFIIAVELLAVAMRSCSEINHKNIHRKLPLICSHIAQLVEAGKGHLNK